MSGASLNKDILAQGGRVLLETCADSHPQKLHVSDLKTLCKAYLVLPLQEYLSFLLRFGYLKLDRSTQKVSISLDGQRLIKNRQDSVLVEQAQKHFQGLLSNVVSEPRPRRRGRPRGKTRPSPVVQRTPTVDDRAFQTGPPLPITEGPALPTSREPSAAELPEESSFEHMEDEPTPTTPLPFETSEGTIGGRYQTVEMLGKGTVGTVFLARQIKMGREVAVKELSGLSQMFPKPLLFKVIRRFAREMTRVATLSHPNIAVLLDGNALKEQPYVVFEYLPGGNLRDLLADNGYLPPETAIPIFMQCLAALRYAHHQGVLHRNLKPSNVLFDGSGNVRLIDFGMIPVMNKELAAQAPRQRLVSTSSVSYIPQEVLVDPTQRSESSDLFSLGMMLYEMLAGRLPGRRSPMPTKLYADLPPIVDELFDRMTHDEPLERYQTADQVLQAFHSAEGFEALMDPGSAVLFWDIGPEEGPGFQDHESVESQPVASAPAPEPTAVQVIGRLKPSMPPNKVEERVRESVHAPQQRQPAAPAPRPAPEPKPPVQSVPDLDSVDLASASEAARDEVVDAPAPGSPAKAEQMLPEVKVGLRDGLLDAEPGGEDSLEIEVDVQPLDRGTPIGQQSVDGLVWEEAGDADNGSGDHPALAWDREPSEGGLVVVTTSGHVSDYEDDDDSGMVLTTNRTPFSED